MVTYRMSTLRPCGQEAVESGPSAGRLQGLTPDSGLGCLPPRKWPHRKTAWGTQEPRVTQSHYSAPDLCSPLDREEVAEQTLADCLH